MRVRTKRRTGCPTVEHMRRTMRLRPSFTTISSADAGARFARAEGPSRDEAERAAIEKAAHWLDRTRRFPTTNE